MFRLFSCKIRLANSLLNEARKSEVTAPEIVLLRVIHSPADGEDAVSEIKSIGKIAEEIEINDDGKQVGRPRTEKEERERLRLLYGPALESIKGVEHLNGVFPPGIPLPKTVEGIPGEVATDEPVKRTKVAA